jgi:hypothetical protein
MAATKEELTRMAQLVRVFQASCEIRFPTPHEINFRLAVMKELGVSFNLKEMRHIEIVGPAEPVKGGKLDKVEKLERRKD